MSIFHFLEANFFFTLGEERAAAETMLTAREKAVADSKQRLQVKEHLYSLLDTELDAEKERVKVLKEARATERGLALAKVQKIYL